MVPKDKPHYFSCRSHPRRHEKNGEYHRVPHLTKRRNEKPYF